MAQVDIFSPFRRRTEHHEDRLTWGFLVALKYAPALQALLRDRVLRDIPRDRWSSRASWEPAAISTQTSILGSDGAFVVSVLVSDSSLSDPVDVTVSSRRARYDGVIEYPDGLVLILENKPRRENVWAGQLSPSRASLNGLSEDAELFERAISIEWAEMLEGVLEYTGSTIAPYAERTVAGDFLTFAEELHPALSPYRTFELCRGRPEAFAKRLESLLASMAKGLDYELGVRSGSEPYMRLPNSSVRQVHLSIHQHPGEGGLSLRQSIWPGDTVSQARTFLNHVDERAFLSLPNAGWEIATNLHFSHMQKHLVWAKPELEVAEYLDLFRESPELVGQVGFNDQPLEDLVEQWKALRLISSEDQAKLQTHFGETRRNFINVIPGFRLTREWPLAAVIELEAQGLLETELITALRRPLETWKESIPMSDSTPGTA